MSKDVVKTQVTGPQVFATMLLATAAATAALYVCAESYRVSHPPHAADTANVVGPFPIRKCYPQNHGRHWKSSNWDTVSYSSVIGGASPHRSHILNV